MEISLDFKIDENLFAEWCGHVGKTVNFEDKELLKIYINHQFVKDYVLCSANDLKFKLYSHISLAIDRLNDLEKLTTDDNLKTYAKNLRVELLSSRFYFMHHYNPEKQ
jgi:hypothetical protein